MILILSQASLEATTDLVMDWLEYFEARHVRLNGTDLEGVSLAMSFDGDTLQTTISGQDIELALGEVDAVWLRRCEQIPRVQNTSLFQHDDSVGENYSNTLQVDIAKHLKNERMALSRSLFAMLDDKPWLSHYHGVKVDKMDVWAEAARAGLNVPITLITNRKLALRSFMDEHESVVTKAIGDAPTLASGSGIYGIYSRYYT